MKKHRQRRLSQVSLASLTNYLVFIAITVSLVNLTVMAFSWWLLFLLLLWLGRLLTTRQPLLVASAFLAGLLCLVFSCGFKMHERRALAEVAEGTVQVALAFDPLYQVIDGNYLRLDGREVGTGTRYRLHYQLKTEQEKESFLALTRPVKVEAQVTLKAPPQARNLHGFDYQAYLRQEQLYHFGDLDEIYSWQVLPLNTPRRWLSFAGNHLKQSARQRLLPLTASYFLQLVLGFKEEAYKADQHHLQHLGLSSLLTLSGLQVLVFFRCLRYGLLRVGITHEAYFWFELALLFLGLFSYAFLSASLGRVFLFKTVTTLGRRWHWQLSRLDYWSLTLILALIVSPYLLLQVGGQLTFGFTFIWLQLEQRPSAGEGRRLKGVRQVLVSSLLALPLLAKHFHQWHVFSLGLSWLLLPVFIFGLWPLLLLTWFSSFIFTPPWQAVFERLLAGSHQWLLQLGSQPRLTVVTGVMATGWFVVSCCVTLLFLNAWQQGKKRAWFLLVCVSLLPLLLKTVNPQGIIAFVDIGQGDALFVQLPFDRGSLLIDTGGRLNFPVEPWQERVGLGSNASYTLLPFLKSRGISQLDYVFLTHGDTDHLGDLAELSQVVRIKKAIFPAGMEQEERFSQLFATLLAQGVELETTLAGSNWHLGELTLTSLAPFQVGKGENKDSLVLSLALKGQRFLQTGDLEAAGEAALVSFYPELTHEVLAAGHHGSLTSSTLPFLKRVTPRETIISAGRNNRYGHPHPEVLANLAAVESQVYRTDQVGMVYYTWYPWQAELSPVKTMTGRD